MKNWRVFEAPDEAALIIDHMNLMILSFNQIGSTAGITPTQIGSTFNDHAVLLLSTADTWARGNREGRKSLATATTAQRALVVCLNHNR
jgi:hypothetical protein